MVRAIPPPFQRWAAGCRHPRRCYRSRAAAPEEMHNDAGRSLMRGLSFGQRGRGAFGVRCDGAEDLHLVGCTRRPFAPVDGDRLRHPLRKHETECEQRQAESGAPVTLWQPGEPGQTIQVFRRSHCRLGRHQQAVDALAVALSMTAATSARPAPRCCSCGATASARTSASPGLRAISLKGWNGSLSRSLRHLRGSSYLDAGADCSLLVAVPRAAAMRNSSIGAQAAARRAGC